MSPFCSSCCTDASLAFTGDDFATGGELAASALVVEVREGLMLASPTN